MRIHKSILCIGVLLLFVSAFGADQFKSGSGDAGKFILQKALAASATPVSTNEVLRVSGGWRYFEDQNGAVIHMTPTNYLTLETFLLRSFGQPKVGPKDTPSGGKYGTYRFTAGGAVLQFGLDQEDGTRVEIIRPLTREEAGDAAARAPTDPQVKKALSKP